MVITQYLIFYAKLSKNTIDGTTLDIKFLILSIPNKRLKLVRNSTNVTREICPMRGNYPILRLETMRRDQIVKSLMKVRNAVAKLNFQDIIEQIRTRSSADKNLNAESILSRYADYMKEYSTFNDNEVRVIESFKLGLLSSASFWSSIIERGRENEELFPMNYNVKVLIGSCENLISLLERPSDADRESIEAISSTGKQETIGIKKLRILVREPASPEISVKSLIAILNDIQNLYDTIVKIYKLPHTELFVGSIDSGSDKSFDVIGVAEAINKLSAFILESWDRIRFSKEQKTEKSFRSVSDGIDLLEKLKKSSENDSISLEEAEKLKRSIIRNMESIISNGVYTPEVESRTPIKPSEIAVERKLLITYQDADQLTSSNQSGQAPKRQPQKVAALKRQRSRKPRTPDN